MAQTRHERFGLEWRPDFIRRLLDLDFEVSDLIKVEEVHEGAEHVIRAELPGIDPEQDVELTVSGGVMRLVAHRTEKAERKEAKGYRSEFRYGEFVREIALPEGAKESDIKATYQDGILEVRIPVGEIEKEHVTRVPIKHTA